MFSKKGAQKSWKENNPLHQVINLKSDSMGSFGTEKAGLVGVTPKLDPLNRSIKVSRHVGGFFSQSNCKFFRHWVEQN